MGERVKSTCGRRVELVVPPCPWIRLQGNKVVEASAILLSHFKELDAESEALGPAYSRPRDPQGRLRFVKGEAQLEIISCFERYGTLH